MNATTLTLPEHLEMWGNPDEKLKIVNGNDFPLNDILNGLGLSKHELATTFGVADVDEIIQRQALMRFLWDNPDFVAFLEKASPRSGLPSTGEEFINYFDPTQNQNPHWKAVHEFLAILDGRELPERLATFRDALGESLWLEREENTTVAAISTEVTRMAAIEGLVTFEINVDIPHYGEKDKPASVRLDYLDSQVHGHRRFSFDLSNIRRLQRPKWLKGWYNPLVWVQIGRLADRIILWQNQQQVSQGKRSMAIYEASQGLISDLRQGAERLLNELFKNWESSKLNHGRVKLYFRYGETGLQLRFVGIEAPGKEPFENQVEQEFDFADFGGYPDYQKAEIARKQKQLTDDIVRTQWEIATASVTDWVARQQPDFFLGGHPIPSRETDQDYRWFAINELYDLGRHKNVTEMMRRHRRFFVRHWQMLRTLANLLDVMQQHARNLGVSLCLPTVHQNGHIVSGQGLIPVQLMLNRGKQRLVPMNGMPELNGRIIGVTGKHGGGKTQLQYGIVANIYLAQSGLPVFGNEFQLNVKKVIGLLFITQRGEGSTIQIIANKIRLILEEIRSYKGHEVVVVLDELGTGTQEISGLELGRDLLRKLRASEVSVIFSSQITELARWAQDECQALCIQLTYDHSIRPGIGDGGMQDLRRRSGLNKLMRV